MKLNIAENIRSMRKERKLTQEQLAEALGVTVGAVSKWESGSSTPDISLIVELAVFFETSVDVLLGYGWQSGGMHEAIERIRALRNEKRFDESSAEAEKALTKYPNSFDVVYISALQYTMKGVELKRDADFRRALELYERAIELIGQNTNDKVNEWTIRNNIASVLLSMGQVENALEQLKKYNIDGLNNSEIGFNLASKTERYGEALVYLSDAFISGTMDLYRVMMGFSNAYVGLGDIDAALSALEWARGMIGSMMLENKVSYLNKAEVQLLAGSAALYTRKGDTGCARGYLTEALSEAASFDASPAYGFTGTRFFHGDGLTTAFDDFGFTALDGIRTVIAEEDDENHTLATILEELTNGK